MSVSVYQKSCLQKGLEELKKKKHAMKIAGIVLTITGGVSVILGSVLPFIFNLIANSLDSNNVTETVTGISALIILLWISYVVGFVALIVGSILLIIQRTVINHKINNRIIRLEQIEEKEKQEKSLNENDEGEKNNG